MTEGRTQPADDGRPSRLTLKFFSILSAARNRTDRPKPLCPVSANSSMKMEEDPAFGFARPHLQRKLSSDTIANHRPIQSTSGSAVNRSSLDTLNKQRDRRSNARIGWSAGDLAKKNRGHSQYCHADVKTIHDARASTRAGSRGLAQGR